MLPMKRIWLHLLVAIAEGNRHGYAIRKTVEERTDGKIRLWPTTLYGTLRVMMEEGLLQEYEEKGQPDDHRQRRFYRLTAQGCRALEEETRRLEDLVLAARKTPALRGSEIE